MRLKESNLTLNDSLPLGWSVSLLLHLSVFSVIPPIQSPSFANDPSLSVTIEVVASNLGISQQEKASATPDTWMPSATDGGLVDKMSSVKAPLLPELGNVEQSTVDLGSDAGVGAARNVVLTNISPVVTQDAKNKTTRGSLKHSFQGKTKLRESYEPKASTAIRANKVAESAPTADSQSSPGVLSLSNMSALVAGGSSVKEGVGLKSQIGANLYRLLLQKRQYPEEALRQRLQGTVRMRIVVGSSFRIAHYEVLSSSGHRALDLSALELVRTVASQQIYNTDTYSVDERSTWIFNVPIAYSLSS